jgi:protein SCO1/2
MRRVGLLVATLLAACQTDPTYIVEGVVVDVRSPTEIVVDHDAVLGLMGPMVMPFRLAGEAAQTPVAVGDRIVARLVVVEAGSHIEKLRITGRDPSVPTPDEGPGPIRAGGVLPAVEVPVTGGGVWRVGEGQGKPTLLAFLYTSCPLPEACPATVRRLAEVQAEIGDAARILAVTIDPAHDTMPVLDAFAVQVGARPDVWRLGRLEDAGLKELAAYAALSTTPGSPGARGRVEHNSRFLVLDAQGRLIERYDDTRFPADRVVGQLRTGGPPAPVGSDGTVTPEADAGSPGHP